MIIANGFIRFKEQVEEQVDSMGYPMLSPDAWGEAIECQYNITSNLQARSNGEAYTSKSFVVWVEQMDVPSEVVMLYDGRGKEVGQFSVISVEQLDAVCQTRLTL